MAEVEGVVSNFSLISQFSPIEEEVLFVVASSPIPKIPMDFYLDSRFMPTEIEYLFCIGTLLPIEEKRGSRLEDKAFFYFEREEV